MKMSFTICWHHHVQRCAMFEHSHDLCSSIFYKYSMLDVGDICVAASLKERGRPATRPQVLVHRHTHTHTIHALWFFDQTKHRTARTNIRTTTTERRRSKQERKEEPTLFHMYALQIRLSQKWHVLVIVLDIQSFASMDNDWLLLNSGTTCFLLAVNISSIFSHLLFGVSIVSFIFHFHQAGWIAGWCWMPMAAYQFASTV